MLIQILGAGCPKCKKLEANTREALAKKKIDADVVKVTDSEEIMGMGVIMTPALVIDGEVKSVGKVLTVDQIASQF
ncbi:MAG TPA: thioredoxin family protein [Treponema sp.]|nr:thioredoxin family protein [Treponema sp.]